MNKKTEKIIANVAIVIGAVAIVYTLFGGIDNIKKFFDGTHSQTVTKVVQKMLPNDAHCTHLWFSKEQSSHGIYTGKIDDKKVYYTESTVEKKYTSKFKDVNYLGCGNYASVNQKIIDSQTQEMIKLELKN